MQFNKGLVPSAQQGTFTFNKTSFCDYLKSHDIRADSNLNSSL